MKPKILIVDDDQGTLASLARAFALEGYTAVTASSAAKGLEKLTEEAVDAVLSDVVMPEMDGLEFLARVKERAAEVPVILMSGQGTIATAVRAMQLGAVEYIEKPVGLERLLQTLKTVLRLDRLQRENRELQKYWQDELALIGVSQSIAALRALVERAAPSDVPILILGENGTGKELVARAVHELSPRKQKPFIKLNCAAVPAELIESELFGHEKGAFSGAVAQHRGRFEQAHEGTILLDEIGDMPAPMQAKLLRALQEGEIDRVGGTEVIKVDVRVISATNKDIDTLIAEGGFREDLYYRLSTLTVKMPPLRDHAGDVPALAAHFVEAACHRNQWKLRRLSPEALDLLAQQPWKGNVRELRNVVERLLILSDADPIGPADVRAALPATAPTARSASPPAAGSLRDLTDAFEREVIRERLRVAGGHVTNAARSLGLERSHLYKKCKQLGIDMREGT